MCVLSRDRLFHLPFVLSGSLHRPSPKFTGFLRLRDQLMVAKQTRDCEGREGTGKVSVPLINNKHILALGKDDKMDQVRISQGFLETCMKVDRKTQHGTHPTAPQQRPGAGKHPGMYRKQEMISNSGGRGNKIGEGRVWGSPVGGADQGLCVHLGSPCRLQVYFRVLAYGQRRPEVGRHHRRHPGRKPRYRKSGLGQW